MNPTKAEILDAGANLGSKTSNGLYIFIESELIDLVDMLFKANRSKRIGSDPTDELRALRLWHWKKVVSSRKAQEKNEALALKSYPIMHGRRARRANQIADFHIKAVQALNDHFPLGDYASNDLAKECLK